MRALTRLATLAAAMVLFTACGSVGPEFVKPEVELPPGWSGAGSDGLESSPMEQPQWWRTFGDPVLNQLVEAAWRQNNSLEIAGLRVLEARAQLGIAQGRRYPQTQLAAGEATYTSPAETLGGGSNQWTYGLGVTASWEIDFWGRYRNGIQAADASYLSSIAARDQALVLLTAQVVGTYVALRVNEEQLRIAHENVALQQRSYDIARVLFENGSDSELDMQQARTLLLSTQASIPGFETAVRQIRNALNVLLGQPPGTIDHLLVDVKGIPTFPASIRIGVPADLLRRRPDVRQAELNAMAQNALVGMAEASLYPSFSLAGSIGLASAGFGDLFDGDALTYTIGPSFYWPFLNYGRIRNNIRVQDTRLQQALVNYRNVVLNAAREAEDAMAGFKGSLQQLAILEETVASAVRSNELSTIRYREGLSGYQRLLDSQQALFTQQQRLVAQHGATISSLISLYTALGGGWENQDGMPLISERSIEEMDQRVNWGGLLDEASLPAGTGSGNQ
jgi:NodT family efflux transporter outer membrane factor (OMF) lipoprotein